jgi:hypothetical protein
MESVMRNPARRPTRCQLPDEHRVSIQPIVMSWLGTKSRAVQRSRVRRACESIQAIADACVASHTLQRQHADRAAKGRRLLPRCISLPFERAWA